MESWEVMLLYHYSFEKNLASIRKEGSRPSIRIEDIPTTDAQHGNGHYLTDLAPDIVEKFTRPQISQALFKLPRKWGLTGKLQAITFIEFNLPDEKLKRVHDLLSGSKTISQTWNLAASQRRSPFK